MSSSCFSLNHSLSAQRDNKANGWWHERKVFILAQVPQHNTNKDYWLIINGKVIILFTLYVLYFTWVFLIFKLKLFLQLNDGYCQICNLGLQVKDLGSDFTSSLSSYLYRVQVPKKHRWDRESVRVRPWDLETKRLWLIEK